jgi:heme-degrading monooxygenase HmoA
MVIVMFEYVIKEGQADRYFETAQKLVPLVEKHDGFLGVERFTSKSQPNRYLSLVYWRDEASIIPWRNHPDHRAAQALGKAEIFEDFRITVVTTGRSYTMSDRGGAKVEAPMKPLA